MNSPGQLQAPPDVFITPLLELRDYYGSLTQKYQTLFLEARSQLAHVESLLSSWSYDDPQKLSQLPAFSEDSLAFLSSRSPSDNYVESVSSTVMNNISIHAAHTEQLEQLEQIEQLEQPTTKTQFYQRQRHHLLRGEEVPMLSQYQNMSRMEALKKVLREYLGTVCHIDFIVRSLYGDLEPTIFKVVKGRVQSSLTQGRESGYWSAIPNEPGCYTIDLTALGPIHQKGLSKGIKTKTPKHFTRNQSKTVPMLPQFHGQFLIDALTSFLEDHPGQVFNVNQVVNGIYGNLDEIEIREVKNKVLNELSRGHRTGRFVRVPHQIGLYTLDMNMVKR